MSDNQQRTCVGCGESEDAARFETCSICRRDFCPDCAFRTPYGKKFCSSDCGRAYYYQGDESDDDDEDDEYDD